MLVSCFFSFLRKANFLSSIRILLGLWTSNLVIPVMLLRLNFEFYFYPFSVNVNFFFEVFFFICSFSLLISSTLSIFFVSLDFNPSFFCFLASYPCLISANLPYRLFSLSLSWSETIEFLLYLCSTIVYVFLLKDFLSLFGFEDSTFRGLARVFLLSLRNSSRSV